MRRRGPAGAVLAAALAAGCGTTPGPSAGPDWRPEVFIRAEKQRVVAALGNSMAASGWHAIGQTDFSLDFERVQSDAAGSARHRVLYSLGGWTEGTRVTARYEIARRDAAGERVEDLTRSAYEIQRFLEELRFQLERSGAPPAASAPPPARGAPPSAPPSKKPKGLLKDLLR